MSTIEKLSQTTIFRGLSEAEANAIVGVGQEVMLAPGQSLFQEGEAGHALYVVLEGRGTLGVEDESFDLEEGGSVYVKAGADHRFTGYEGLSVLVVFDKSQTA